MVSAIVSRRIIASLSAFKVEIENKIIRYNKGREIRMDDWNKISERLMKIRRVIFLSMSWSKTILESVGK